MAQAVLRYFHIIDKNNDNINVNSYNTSWETKLLKAICKVWILLETKHALSL